MKKSLHFIFVLGLIIFSSCSTNLKKVSSGKSIDTRLIGVWDGIETNEDFDGIEKKWEMIRRDDGTFTLSFTYSENGNPQNKIETGKWWIDNGKFHEYNDVSGNTDIYKYKVLNNDQIKFIAKKMSVEMPPKDYEFINKRKK